MITKISGLMHFSALFTKDGVGVTGLTVTAEIIKNGVAILFGQPAPEIASAVGLHRYTLPIEDIDAPGDYICILKAVGDVDANWIPAAYTVGPVEDTAVATTADMDANSTQLAAIVAAIAALNDMSVAELQTELATLNDLSVAELQTELATLNDVSPAEVKTEISNALAVDTYGELADIPPAVASIATKLSMVAMFMRNSLAHGNDISTLYADDDLTPVGVATVTDDSVTTKRGKYG